MLTPLNDALDMTFEAIGDGIADEEIVELPRASGRVLSQDVTVPEDVPAFDRANMDGYAVVHSDLEDAQANPRILPVVEVVPTGYCPSIALTSGMAVQVATGAMVPAGTTAVVMKENTEKIGSDRVKLMHPARAGEHLVIRGADLKAGETLLASGHRLRSIDLAALATLGVSQISAWRSPRVAIIATGDELVEPGEPLGAGKIYNSSSYMLEAALTQDCCHSTRYPVVRDNLDDIVEIVDTALSDHDLILLIGGSSVGDKDLSRATIERFIGQKILLHGIAMRPGRPTIVASVAGKLVVGLPGHPVSTRAIYDALVRPALGRMARHRAASSWGHPGSTIKARLSHAIAASPDLDLFVRLRISEVDNALVAHPVTFVSFSVSSMVKAHGWAVIKANDRGLPAGEAISITLF